MSPGFSPLQLGYAIHKLIAKQKEEIAKKAKKPDIKMEWIRITSNAIVDTIEREMKKFNNLHPNNQISSNDLLSTLQTTLNRFLKAIGITIQPN